jgi:hypothetical protein
MSAMDKFHKVVAKEMSRYGFDVNITVNRGDGVYDPVTSTYTESTTTLICRGILFDYTLQSNGTSTHKSTLIQAGDKHLFLQPPMQVDPNTLITSLSPEKDNITIGTDTYSIVTFKEVNPSVSNSCLWEVYIRK